ncbi:hypothetical protein Poli38472_000068 [Pythium oligandrum]|uniref:DUF5745 domain-containing protein n=1 Tax=Pythium oligandrum TaxID=41045 RepID=A0A8K1CBQ7_PYTOL|nr:hypothetical protein Poli38472_000068 [Pythium oligandrum]|eukprot:TMW60026.1 hypothetical protein Poli38472_000068 [Pythium oligandrum]
MSRALHDVSLRSAVDAASVASLDEVNELGSLSLSDAARRMQALLATNALLDALGFGERAFDDYDDLVASVSSMSVALYEKLFQFRLDRIVRVPSTLDDYENNAQVVVDALSGALLDESFDMDRITGKSLCAGDVESIEHLMRMFQQIYDLLYGEQEEIAEETEPQHITTSKKKSTATTTKSQTTRVKRSTTSKQTKTRPSRRPPPTSSSAKTPPMTMKKRTRQAPSAPERQRTRGTTQCKSPVEDPGLLTTQRYGRYIPVPHRDVESSHPSDESFLSMQHDQGNGLYFGAVSSVSGASDSAASIHFMEEEGEFARNFSVIQSYSSPGTNSKESPETESTPDRINASIPGDSFTTPRKSRNQEDADVDDRRPARTSSTKKQQPMTKSTAKKTTTTTKGKLSTPTGALYPLNPETKRRDRTSKAHTEFLRYKLELKDRLQDLRHREFCQRQHLERAYRLGEHAASVERIRARRFEQELRLHRISIGLEAKTQEEKQLRDAMDHLLLLEKDKLREEHRTTKQTLRIIQQEHAEREKALENFYATQIQLVREQTQREIQERSVVEKAHRMASEQVVREMRRDREKQLMSLLQEKEHLANVRRFRHATQLQRAVDKGTEAAHKRSDAFYAAAMKARQLRAAKTAQDKTKTVYTSTRRAIPA